MSNPFTRLRAKNLMQSTYDYSKWAVILCGAFILLFGGCSGNTSNSGADNNILVRERERVEAEKRSEREATIRELLARNIPADTNSEKMWTGFRQAYPYHSQVLALSSPSTDKSRTLIISEPPPHLTAGDILLSLGDLLRNHSEQKQKIGYDGWVKDLVVEIVGNQSDVDSAISSLNRLLFNTSYKSYILPLPANVPTDRMSLNLDLQVTSAELKKWVLDDNETFTPVEGGDSFSFQQLFEQKISGVFYGDRGGLVAWFIPQGRTVDECRVQARQFLLDSDLIVGAFSKNHGILVLGRDRIIPVDQLPPLRVETLSLLAAAQQGQSGKLAQSYERNYLFAGRIEGNKDWAPILLSPELRDTEYGSLLNITDQLLKGWSNNGETSYYNFKYPRPDRWPFKGSLMDQLNTTELVYNWNTRGAGYTVDISDYRLLALNRTGALPVSYFPIESKGRESSGTTRDAEETAYDYFAKLNDPNLVRVVQYAAIYQIFSAFNIAKPPSPPPSTSFPDKQLEEMTSSLLAEIRNFSPQQIEDLTHQLIPLVSAQLNGKDVFQLLMIEMMKEKTEHITQFLQANGYDKGTPRYSFEFNRLMGEAREDVHKMVNAFMAKKKEQLPKEVRDQIQLAADGIPADGGAEVIRQMTLSQFAGLRKLPERYSEASGSQSSGWIHTPAIVISWNTGALFGGIGGHNLDAKVTQFRISDDVVPGTTRIDGEGNILVNSSDFDKVNSLVRTAGRAEGESASELSSELNIALKGVSEAPPRSQAAALSLPASPPLPPKGPPTVPISFDSPTPDFGGGNWHPGWARPRAQLPEPDPLAILLGQRRAEIPGIIIIDRDSTGLISIANSVKSPAIKATTNEDAVDAIVQLMRKAPDESQPLSLEFRGFREHEARGFTQSCSIRASSEKIPREISSIVNDATDGSVPIANKGGAGDGGGSFSRPPSEGNGGTGGKISRGNSGSGNGEGDGSGSSSGTSGGGEGGNKLLLELGRRKYNFTSAKVTVQPEIEVLNDGTQISRITVEVPPVDAENPGLSTIKLGFRKSTPREVVAAATRKVADSVRNFIRRISDEFQAIRFNLRLNSEIKRVSKEMGIDMKLIRHSFSDGKGDLYFAKRKGSNEPLASDTATCQSA